MARSDYRDQTPPKFGKPGITYPHGDKAYPTITIERTATKTEATTIPAFLSAHPDAAAYPGALLVQIKKDKGDDTDKNLTLVYETLPGPWVISVPRFDEDGFLLTQKTRRNITANIAVGETLVATLWTRTTKQGSDVNVAEEVVETRTIPGRVVRRNRWSEDERVMISSWWQLMEKATATTPVVGSTYLTGSIMVHNTIVSLTVTDPGRDYIALPTITIEASPTLGGTNATVDAAGTRLTAVAATLANAGSGYTPGNAVTFTGGTLTVAAVGTVTCGVATLALLTAGTNYLVGDILTLEGGIYTTPATATVSTLKLVGVSLNANGTGYVPGDTLTLFGGTGTAATLTVSTVAIDTVAINTAGTGYVPGDVLTLVSGTGTAATLTVLTVGGGGDILTFSYTYRGNYTVAPAGFTCTGGAGTLATWNTAIYRIAHFVIASGGSYTVGSTTFTHTGGTGGGATFQSGVFGVNTFTVSGAGQYSTAATSFYQASTTSAAGLGATFNTPTWTPNGLTITTGGIYTAVPTGPATQNSVSPIGGTGLTAALNFGLGTVTLGTAGTGYVTEFPAVTVSAGTASVTAIVDALAVSAGKDAYILNGQPDDEPGSQLVARMRWESAPLPPNRKSYPSVHWEEPAFFTLLANTWPDLPWPGFHYTFEASATAAYPARESFIYGLTQPTNLPAAFVMRSPGAASRMFPCITSNTAHAALAFQHTESDGINPAVVTYAEIFPASTPYRKGQIVTVAVSARPWDKGGNIWEVRVVQLKSTGPLY